MGHIQHVHLWIIKNIALLAKLYLCILWCCILFSFGNFLNSHNRVSKSLIQWPLLPSFWIFFWCFNVSCLTRKGLISNVIAFDSEILRKVFTFFIAGICKCSSHIVWCWGFCSDVCTILLQCIHVFPDDGCYWHSGGSW